MRAKLAVLLLFLGQGCAAVSGTVGTSTPALRGLPDGVELREYDVQGASAEELRARLDQSAPRDEAGARHDAFTRWYVKWSYPFERSDAGCATGPVTISLAVSVELPRWSDAEGASDELKVLWQRYLDALVTHELGHREHGAKAGEQIERELPLLPARPTCDEAAAAANAEGHKVLARFRQADVDYDAATDHGATQGARFP